ncbi:3-deoxy-D-manno-octulosonic acid transferase [Chitinophaga pendula]|uniref:3-deoxy-D-manno-octulosonic acid transferase n=1 Tax=Chitinophaga TaxID=79328 RepID=UPI000BAF9C2D|nr:MULTISPECIES: glycosyltransferase N-terminal domain-containing protein [Chitinophaga]ASZ11151.1 3-deoxy-D-manno-octulosonic acid transferase [Chitinophaga sp. MD30]UCJ05852.1 3-deoxy-D-manno-octulosonic acid transferase [Chitinophaga pendula]
MMATWVYSAGIGLYRVGVWIAAVLGKEKARLWLAGRRSWEQRLGQAISAGDRVVWVHAASLGEFEQGRPVLEAIRQQYPSYKILLTFFSPSGYEVRKDYKGADYTCYLPLDTPANARHFLAIARPQLAIFIKYEFWYHFLTALYRQQVPTLLVSGVFRPGQVFFRGYGGMFRRLLRQLTHIFVQNNASLACLQPLGLSQVSVAGDTRFDRVWALREEAQVLPLVAGYCGDRKTLIAGSTWEADEVLLSRWWSRQQDDLQLVIAPHEIQESHIQALLQLFPDAVRYTALKAGAVVAPGKVLIIDNVGMLAAMYRYAHIAYVGGGFGKEGIHNILEPAAYGKPVLFGPIYDKFPEAEELLQLGGALVVQDMDDLLRHTKHLLHSDNTYRFVSGVAAQYVADHQGATGRVLDYIQEKRFLTRE